MQVITFKDTSKLESYLRTEGYFGFRTLNGKICGLHQYFTTCGIVVGLSDMSYERRYCYQDRLEAESALASWDEREDHPPGNWIKLKGVFKGQAVDYFNPWWVSN